MPTLKCIQAMIDYIEENLKCELSILELANLAGFSPYHFSRLFCNVVGMPLNAYITKRRLYHGIYAIQNGAKITDVALDYGFDTYPGFYKAFVKEFGCSPRKYLKLTDASRPVPVNLAEDGKYMLTQTQIRQFLKTWDIDQRLPIYNTFTAGNTRKSNDTWSIGEQYIFKTGKNIAGLKTHNAISRNLVQNGLAAATVIPTKNGQDFIVDNERYFVLTNRIKGRSLTTEDIYNDPFNTGRIYGEGIAKLHQVLAKQDQNLEVDDNQLHETVLNWALPKARQLMEQWGYSLPNEFYQEYTTNFSKLYLDLPRHIIHRDPNPSNILFENGEIAGFIDFVISERNVRLFDPCYCATGILSEVASLEAGFAKWPEILRGIIDGYNKIVQLTLTERRAIPYIIYSIQLIFIAWLDGREEFKELALQNRDMLVWLWNNQKRWAIT